MFDRYKESNGDYRSQARLVIFGLRDNAKLRERLFAGTLHCLEIAYASDEVRAFSRRSQYCLIVWRI